MQRRSRGGSSLCLCVVVLTVLYISWSGARAEEYAYPYHDPYLATVTAALLNSDDLTPRLKRQIVHVPALPGRDDLPTMEGRGDLKVTLYRQHRPAPLLFVLSGIGTNPYFGLGTYFAGLFHAQGSHVVLLPSPMTWNFALAASRSGAPGYVPDDARDLYVAMQKTLDILKARYGLQITRINFVGASLGALEGAHLSVIDAEEGKIGIDTYLLINPPLDLSYALEKVDEWGALQDKLGPAQSKGLLAKALAIVESFGKDKRDDPKVFERFTKAFSGFTQEQLQFLISEDLEILLPELVYATQLIHEQGVLKAPPDQMRKRLEEAKRFNFKDYSEKIGVPLWRAQAGPPDGDLQTFTRRGSLAAVLDRVRGNARVHFMHNADDFLADPKSMEELKQSLGDQLKVYPYGGHLGNLWYPETRDYVLRLFKAPP